MPSWNCNRALVGSFNGDGRPDVLACFEGSGIAGAEAWRPDATGDWQPLGSLQLSLASALRMKAWAADFDGDGIDDPVLFRGYESESYVAYEFAIGLTGQAIPRASPTLSGAPQQCR